MHSLSHLLSAIPLTEFKTISEEEKEVVHKDFTRVRSMIERKLHDLITREAGESVRSADVVDVAREFFAGARTAGRTSCRASCADATRTGASNITTSN